jgi:glycosyltransferase involved in cell wall biosynthesis
MISFKDVWEVLGTKYKDVTLTIICDTFLDTEHIALRKVHWRLETEIDDLKALDIGVMPLFNDVWSRGKCGFKILQYLGVGVPAVCTPVGINRDVVDNGVNGFWAETKQEWVDKLSLLIEDYELRLRMGKEGRKKIMDRYTVQVCAPLLTRWLRELC